MFWLYIVRYNYNLITLDSWLLKKLAKIVSFTPFECKHPQ